ncbi:UvrD-helicase domain-containing protein [Glutamicibacter creatinolyticus]|uniref:UvrD-helicase domain-containing protein n=1 Tax=Glutamicibacter creatinolyticus TaxID=162496 RepID=UPI0037BFB73F
MNNSVLTDEQQLALQPQVQLIEAGPGSGKTRTVVQRMHTVSQTSKAGRALISFTNAAADEAMRRASANGTALLPPNFVGTFDGFLHRFIVTPWHVRRFGTRPNYVHSWDDLGNGLELIRHREVSGTGLKMSSFRLQSDETFVYPIEASGSDRIYAKQLEKAGFSPSDLAADATRRAKALLANGVFDSDCARLRALKILKAEENSWLLQRLSLRFHEIIVDEFQDCSDLEIAIIDALKSMGIHVVVVADPDQAIYEFRQASPISYQHFRQNIDPGSIVDLATNHRSTPAICEFISSLRMIGGSSIDAAKDDVKTKIRVFVGSVDFQRHHFTELLVSEGVPLCDSIILSHRKRDAAALAGTAVDKTDWTHRTFRVLRSIAVLRTSKSTRTRRSEIQKLGNSVLDLFAWEPAEQRLRTAEKREILEISDPQIASFGSALIAQSANWVDLDMARSSIIGQTQVSFGQLARPLKSLKVSLQKLNAKHWKWWQEALQNASDWSLPSSHIHSVKGQEFDAVLLSLGSGTRSQSTVLDDWENGESTEALRVFYVGASRAKQVLAIACPPKSEVQFRRILTSYNIDVKWIVE